MLIKPNQTYCIEQAALAEIRAGTYKTQSGTPVMQKKDGVCKIWMNGILVRDQPQVYEAAEMGSEAVSYPFIIDAVTVAALDKEITRIDLLVDSPGGDTNGMFEASDAIHAATTIKRVDAFIIGVCESAAYCLVSQCSHITAKRLSKVGSIGCYTPIIDESAAADQAGVKVTLVKSGPFKGVGYPGTEVTDSQLAPFQRIVDQICGYFIDAVSRGRRMSREKVAELATGEFWIAEDARANGLIDEVSDIYTGADSGSFLQQSKALAQSKGITVTKAMSILSKNNPKLHEDFLRSCQ